MWNDWNFWCSIITAIAAIVALILSVKQSRLSNKQQLFERRLRAYMLANGLISLCKDRLNEKSKIFNNVINILITLNLC